MDLATARAVLQRIVATNEKTINEATPLDRISGDSTETVRQALAVVSLSISDNHGEKMPGFMMPEIGDTTRWDTHKPTPQGHLGLYRDARSVELYLNGPRNIRYGYALTEPDSYLDRSILRFMDSNAPEGEQQMSVALWETGDKPKIEGIKLLHRGLRWMCANLLEWDKPTVVMPEQLDSLPLPSAQVINPSQTS